MPSSSKETVETGEPRPPPPHAEKSYFRQCGAHRRRRRMPFGWDRAYPRIHLFFVLEEVAKGGFTQNSIDGYLHGTP